VVCAKRVDFDSEKLLGLLDARQLKTFNDRLQAVVPRESLRDSP